MRATTTMFTLFGAFIVPRGGEVRVGILIRLMRPLGLSPNAIRLALSRMSRRGWLARRKTGRQSHYSLTKKGHEEMLAGKHWALDKERKPWDKKWRLVVYTVPETMRRSRDRIRQQLLDLGYGNLGGSLWVSPCDTHPAVREFLEREKTAGYVEMFEARYAGTDSDRDVARKAWKIAELERRYQNFIDRYCVIFDRYHSRMEKNRHVGPAECFARRFSVTAEFIGIALQDPLLPLELLPPGWVGLRAKQIYLEFWKFLTPEADRFVDSVVREGKAGKI